ncbi:MAG: glycosyl transferase [Rhodobacterales bacterium]|nr:MAG: glycosyl transferase [Rhodobacterales bacterium]
MSVLPQPAVLDFPSPQKVGDKSAAKPAKSAPDKRTPIGEILVRSGALSPDDLLTALALRNREETRLGYILTNHDMVSEADLYSALSEQFQADLVDLQAEPPLPHLSGLIDMDYCIKENIIPWRDLGGAIIIATSRPDQFERVRSELPPQLGTVLMAIAPEYDIQNALAEMFRAPLVEHAETCVAEQESCRLWNTGRMFRFSLAALLGFLTFSIINPSATFTALCIAAIFILMVNMGLKTITTASQIRPHLRRNRNPHTPPAQTTTFRLPVVSIMVPLFREREVASHLIRRLKRLNYPKELLDICLVVEADDDTTNETLSHTQLPRWARVIRVPTGNVRTKPRAMNYALKFCRGSIIGVYDAEDAPHPDQIHQIVRRFHERGPQVACLQGLLDFYNPRTNWLSRCFTIEYNTWFRLFLPGLEKLGFAVPLGGTTLFFRRAALEKLGGWDAHNVTEDADLGIRLARHGLRTEIVHTVTEEEANCRFVPWIKQRSRWLKGFAITWAVHMRSPGKTLRELGLKKFIGMQILFIGTFSHFLLAPLLWSFWLILFGVHHPILDVVNSTVMIGLTAVFLLSEIITIAVGCFAISDKKHRFLMGWTPTMHFYFPMGTLAAYKALYELVTQPFYWDKTAHGIFERTEELAPES